MGEFWTACTTCQAKLKVRDVSLVGQIVACPKCGSMVLIAAPAGSTPTTSTQAPTPAGETPAATSSNSSGKPAANRPRTEFALDDLNDLLAGRTAPPSTAKPDATPAPAPHAPAAPTTKANVETPPKPQKPQKTKPAKPSASAASTPTAAPPEPTATANSAPAPQPHPATTIPSAKSSAAAASDVASTAAQVPGRPDDLRSSPIRDVEEPVAAARRALPQPVILGGAALAGLLLAVVVFYAIPRWLGRGDATQEQTKERSLAQNDQQANNKPPPDTDQQPTENAGPVTPAEPNPATKPSVESAKQEQPGGAASPPEKPTEKPTEKSTEEPGPPSADLPKDEPSKSPPDKPAPKPAGKPNELPGPPELTPADKNDAGPSSLEPVAGKFAQLITGVPAPADGGMVGKPPEEAPPDLPSASVPDGPELLRPRMRDVDVPARLADSLASIEFPNVALADYLQLLSDLSTIPMTLDVDALMLRQLSPATPVAVKLENTTVRVALAQVLEPLKLGYTAIDGHVVISHPVASDGALRKRTYDVADLVAKNAATSTAITQWILELIEPDSWTEAGGRGIFQLEGATMTVEQTDAAHLEIILLLDRLRAARKLPPRGKFPPALLNPDTLPSRAQAALQTPITLNYARPTRLTQILERFGRVAGVRLVVDWRSLADSSWPPETTATITVEKRSLAETLTQLLGPRDLTYRVIDDSTILITTPNAVARHVEWEFHSIPDPKSDDYDPAMLIDRIRERVGAEYFRDAGGVGSLYFDPPSHCLLVALPQPQQRQVAALLKEAAQSNAAVNNP